MTRKLGSKHFTTTAAFVSLTMTASALTGCGRNGSTVQATIDGMASFGPVAEGTVTAHPIDDKGVLNTSETLATTKTDAEGKYTLKLKKLHNGPIGVQISGGTYSEEANGAKVKLTRKFTTVIPEVTEGDTLQAAVGPLGEMAFQRLQEQVKNGGLAQGSTVSEIAKNSNFAVSQAFGISDIVGTLPSNPNGTIGNDDKGKYALVLAALSKAAVDAGTDSTAMAAALAANFKAQGVINPSATTVVGADGKTRTFIPPTGTQLTNTMTNITSGTLKLPKMKIPAGFVPPVVNPVPPKVAPPSYRPGTEVTVPAKAIAPVSCTAAKVVGSVTRTFTIGSATTTSCTDFVGSRYTVAKLRAMCTAPKPGSAAPCVFATTACSIGASSGYVAGFRVDSQKDGDQINRFYQGYTADQIGKMAAGQRAPACTTGT